MTSTCCQNHKYNINTSPPRSFVLALLTNLPVPDRALQSGLFPISLHHLPFDFFLSLSLPFFSFLKKKIRLHQGSGLVNHSIQGSFPVNQPPWFLFFHLVQWTGYQIMAANASRHKPSPLFSDIQNNDISPSHPLRSSRALVPTECLLYGDPFISHTASLPPENTPVYAVTPQTQTQNSPNREREANGLYFSFLRVNRLVIYHGINMPDMFMKAVISRSKKFPKES